MLFCYLIFLRSLLNCQKKNLILILFFCVSLPGYTWQSGMKYSDIKLQLLQDEGLTLLL